MTNRPVCGKCGSSLAPDAPEGLCLKCLLDTAIEDDAEHETLGPATPGARLDLSPAAPGGVPEPLPLEATGVEHARALSNQRFGDFELLEETGRGGMGIVYKARQTSLDRFVALKMILFGHLATPEQIRRFRTEASAVAALQHPNIVAVHEVGVHQNQHYLAMDYVDGPNLSGLVKNRPLPAKQAAAYLKAIAEAIHFAHERGILHRDVKPSNVLVGSDDRPRVADFGLARRLETDSSLTVSGAMLGSPNYMPPEQVRAGKGKVGRASDVYGLGAVLYHLLTARPPFQAETIPETLHLVTETEPLSPRALVSSVPRDLETICLKCLEKDPAKRYPTAQALAEELERFLKGEPIEARPAGAVGKVWRWCRRKPAVAGAVSVVFASLVAVAVVSTVSAVRTNRARQAERLEAYYSAIALADQYIQQGNIAGAKKLLFQCPSEFRHWEWGRLVYLCHQEILTITAHTNPPPVVYPSQNSDATATNSSRGHWVSGTAPFGYQWWYTNNSTSIPLDGVANPSALKSILYLTNVQPSDIGGYFVVVTNAVGSATSQVAQLTVDPTFLKITTGRVVTDAETSWSATWFDLDNDGDLDLFVANTGGSVRSSMYRNNGDGSFTKLTNAVTAPLSDRYSAPAGDFDNDGFLDLVLVGSRGAARNYLFRNAGNGEWIKMPDATFAPLTYGSGDADWVDYDRDGLLDLFSQQGGSGNRLYRNRGDGTFASIDVGLDHGNDNAQECAWSDYDNDGWADVFLGSFQPGGGLFRNNGQGWFARVDTVDLSAASNAAIPAWPDYDNDGFADLFVPAFMRDGSARTLLYRNLGDSTFTNVTEAAGLVIDNHDGLPSAWGDYDNDGFLDLIVRQRNLSSGPGVLWHSEGDGTFKSVNVGSPLLDGSFHNAPLWADYDNDGFLDLLLVCGGNGSAERNHLYRNNSREAGNANHWLKVKIEGRVSNRAAIGAKVRVRATVGGKSFWQLRELSANTGWTTYTTLIAHFGLGDATNVTTVRIEWPSGIVQELKDVAADQHLRIVEHEDYPPGPPPALTGTTSSAAGLQMTIQEPAAGARYALEGSTDLENWAMLLARTSAGATHVFSDTKMTNYPVRFYRVIVPQGNAEGGARNAELGSWFTHHASRGSCSQIGPGLGGRKAFGVRCPEAPLSSSTPQPQANRGRQRRLGPAQSKRWCELGLKPFAAE